MITFFTCAPSQIINAAKARNLEVPQNVADKANLLGRNGIEIGIEEQNVQRRESYSASLKFNDQDVFISQGPNIRKPTGFAGSAYYALKDLFSKINEHTNFYTINKIKLS